MPTKVNLTASTVLAELNSKYDATQKANAIPVLGNTACDLDSTMSAIVLAFEMTRFAKANNSNDVFFPCVNAPRDEWQFHFETEHQLKVLFGDEYDGLTSLNFKDDVPELHAAGQKFLIVDFNGQETDALLTLDHHETAEADLRVAGVGGRAVFGPEETPLDALTATGKGEDTPLAQALTAFLKDPRAKPMELTAGTKVGSAASLVALLTVVMEKSGHATMAESCQLLRGVILQDTKNFKEELKGVRWNQFDIDMVEHCEAVMEKDSIEYPNRKPLRKALNDDSSFQAIIKGIGPIGLLSSDTKFYNYPTTDPSVYHKVAWASLPCIEKGIAGYVGLMDGGYSAILPAMEEWRAANECDVIVLSMKINDTREIGLYSSNIEDAAFWSAVLAHMPEDALHEPNALMLKEKGIINRVNSLMSPAVNAASEAISGIGVMIQGLMSNDKKADEGKTEDKPKAAANAGVLVAYRLGNAAYSRKKTEPCLMDGHSKVLEEMKSVAKKASNGMGDIFEGISPDQLICGHST